MSRDVLPRSIASSMDTLRDLQLTGQGGQSVPLGAVGEYCSYEIEQPTIWRRAQIHQGSLKAGHRHQRPAEDDDGPVGAEGGGVRQGTACGLFGGDRRLRGGKRQEPVADIVAVVPLMLFVMATVLMIRAAELPSPVPGVCGRAACRDRRRHGLLPSGAPLGFVAILGVLALIGILVRNSVILIVQIENLKKEGRPAWDAVVEATEHRMRPILLTAAAASLALIPIAREIFWGPMAYAMMGGIIVGTLLTLLFLPALYVAWFRIQPNQDDGRSTMTPWTRRTTAIASNPNLSRQPRRCQSLNAEYLTRRPWCQEHS